MSENSLAIFTKAAQMLAEADTIQKCQELKDLALTAMDWAKRRDKGKEAIQLARSYALEAERKMGEMLLQTERAKGGQPYQESTSSQGLPVDLVPLGDQVDDPIPELPTLKELGLTKKESSKAQFLAELPAEDFEQIKSGDKTLSDVKREIKRAEVISKLEDVAAVEAKRIEGVYDVIVLDPPWPMEKIERDCRPNQVEFDYPTMTEDELAAMDIPAAEDCHVWVWTTHRFMPMAFRLLDAWGLKYVCAFVWHKPGGMQVAGLPQYNCEFALYARKGSPSFVDTKAFFTCFEGARGAHSEKPDEFYDVIRRVTAGRRLDMFNRRPIEGFDRWGNES